MCTGLRRRGVSIAPSALPLATGVGSMCSPQSIRTAAGADVICAGYVSTSIRQSRAAPRGRAYVFGPAAADPRLDAPLTPPERQSNATGALRWHGEGADRRRCRRYSTAPTRPGRCEGCRQTEGKANMTTIPNDSPSARLFTLTSNCPVPLPAGVLPVPYQLAAPDFWPGGLGHDPSVPFPHDGVMCLGHNWGIPRRSGRHATQRRGHPQEQLHVPGDARPVRALWRGIPRRILDQLSRSSDGRESPIGRSTVRRREYEAWTRWCLQRRSRPCDPARCLCWMRVPPPAASMASNSGRGDATARSPLSTLPALVHAASDVERQRMSHYSLPRSSHIRRIGTSTRNIDATRLPRRRPSGNDPRRAGDR